MHNGRGLGIETGTEPSEQVQRSTQPAKEAMAKLNQIITVSSCFFKMIVFHVGKMLI
jgi:autophagy-related protein 13